MQRSATSDFRPPPSGGRRAAVAGGLALVLAVSVAGCGSASSGSGDRSTGPSALSCPGSTSGFDVPLAVIEGGQATPVAAARHFAAHGNTPGIPTGGWRVLQQLKSTAVVRSGNTILDAARGSDGTWLIQRGTTCLS